MEFVVILIICAIIGLLIAQNKGNNGLAGFCFGLFLGPFGVIITLVLPENKKKLNAERGYTKRCPYCAELVKGRAIKCKHCGSDLGPLEVDLEEKS